GENLDIALYVETTCTRRKESCTVTKVYYKWKKEDGSGRQEDSWQWVTGAERRAAHGTNEREEMEETKGTSSLPQRKYHR
ncbi:MAG: hypothetical protein Q4F29_12680, partial [Lachnospiraceae bacterium]|nr:hypothetical protein [Lachnospiraceae bacterium]